MTFSPIPISELLPLDRLALHLGITYVNGGILLWLR